MDGGQEAQGSMNDSGDARPLVLVVEDFEDNRFMMRRLLEMSGYRVVEAVNGNQAVERAASDQPDIILMDLSLPQLDGLAATRRIRTQEDSRRVPIVAVSAHDSADFHAEALAAGCNEYVTKPIDFDQLVGLLDRLTAK
ncbi:MAG: hypothetical protein QOH49_1105 [Acidobacteriota bacterium]|jgi:CheY-like chemotaxis protein|nr:hypothetical protein [Acidobacteriota bacterium]